MNRFLQQVIWGNTVQDYLWTAGVIIFILLLNNIISRFAVKLTCRVFRRQWKDLNEQTFMDLVVHPLSLFLTISICIIMLYRLQFPKGLNFQIYKYSLQEILQAIGTIIQIASFIWLLLRIIDFIASLLERRASLTADLSDNQLIVFFKDFLKVVLGIIGLLMILHFAFNYNISSLLTGLSIVGAAIALALRESLENLIASFVIFFDKPFTTGDLVKVHNITGNAERIGLRSTRIRTDQKTYVTVPNKQMVDSILDNLSLRSQRKGELWLHMNLATPLEKLQQVITQVKGFLSKIEEVQSSNVLFNEITPNAFVVYIEFFTLPIDVKRFNDIRQEINIYAIQTLENLGVRIVGAPAPPPPLH
ncbi:MAG: mechanosensitive ion channel [Flavisolibacter sp.]|nr:mechanosensitive ion channel [Flavisolibacter sp.]